MNRPAAIILAVAIILPVSASRVDAAPADQDFILGADVSALATPNRPGSRRGPLPEYQEHGVKQEEWQILLTHGWNMFRLRVFVSPVRNAPDNSLSNTVPLAQRIKAAGGKLLLCLHLSDTWADPQHQDIPVAWRDLDLAGLEKAVEAHTFEVVSTLKAARAMPDWVQVGNEITVGTLWPVGRVTVPDLSAGARTDSPAEARQWENLTRLLQAGIRGVNAAAGDTPPRIALHIDKGANWPVTQWFFDHIAAARINYDLIAQSFYPEWNHGRLEQLWTNLEACSRRYNKPFVVVESGYGRSRVPENSSMLWPETPEGRLQFMADLINTVKKAPGGAGVMYWAPEREAWNTNGTPGPVVYVRDRAPALTNRPASHAPTAVFP